MSPDQTLIDLFDRGMLVPSEHFDIEKLPDNRLKVTLTQKVRSMLGSAPPATEGDFTGTIPANSPFGGETTLVTLPFACELISLRVDVDVFTSAMPCYVTLSHTGTPFLMDDDDGSGNVLVEPSTDVLHTVRSSPGSLADGTAITLDITPDNFDFFDSDLRWTIHYIKT